MLGRIIFLTVTATAIFIGYMLSTIHVTSNFEKPLTFKLLSFFIGTAISYSEVKSYFTGIESIIHFRNQSQNRHIEYRPPEDISVINEEYDGRAFRIYRSKEADDTKQLLPTVIFYHGGGYVVGSVETYNDINANIARSLHVNVIAISYRLAPENPFPIPVNDCWKTTNYLIENDEKFKIDANRIALMGDSAGGSIAAVLTQRFAKENRPYPKLQALIYPKLQAFNFRLPSYLQYETHLGGLSSTKMTQWHFGFVGDEGAEINRALMKNEHASATLDESLIRKYESYLDMNQIPDKYKINKEFYAKYEELRSQNKLFPTVPVDKNGVLYRNKERIKQMFSTDMSPVLADDDLLRKLPKTYLVVLEWDVLRDEELAYSYRLKKNDVDIELDFHEDAFHGIYAFAYQGIEFKKSIKILENLKDYLKRNL